jgi:hypothetical protein
MAPEELTRLGFEKQLHQDVNVTEYGTITTPKQS